MGTSSSTSTTEFDIRDKYPQCVPPTKPQTFNDCYALSHSYTYSYRNCITNLKNGVEPQTDDDIIVAKRDDILQWSVCGDAHNGGFPDCVALKLSQRDGNPAKVMEESEVKDELLNNGPVTAEFVVDEKFRNCMKKDRCHDPPYAKPAAPSKGPVDLHTTIVIGFGTTDKGINYWKCVDSNADANNDKYEYLIEEGKGLFDFKTNDIQNPQQYSKAFRKDIGWGGTLSSATRTVDAAHWGGSLGRMFPDLNTMDQANYDWGDEE